MLARRKLFIQPRWMPKGDFTHIIYSFLKVFVSSLWSVHSLDKIHPNLAPLTLKICIFQIFKELWNGCACSCKAHTMCIVHKGFRGFRAASPASNLGINLTGLEPAIPYDTIHSTLPPSVEKTETSIDKQIRKLKKQKEKIVALIERYCNKKKNSFCPPASARQLAEQR